MLAVLLDFNGTMIFDTSLHLEAWSKIYWELYTNSADSPSPELFCGPRNDEILKNMAPWLDQQQRDFYSERKEALYRIDCASNPVTAHLVNGIESFLRLLQEKGVPYGLASASIKANIDFFYEHFRLDRWFAREDIVYDDGTYPNKGAMHLEAARRLGVDFADCLIIEDSLSSIRQAKQNGAGCIVAVADAASACQYEGLADYVISDFTEFDPAWLDR